MNTKLLFCSLFLMFSMAASAQSYRDEAERYRKEYFEGFTKDQNSPLKEEDFNNIHFFDADSSFRVNAKVTVLNNQQPFKMPTYDGTSKDFVRYAKLDFMLSGKPYQLTLYRNLALAANDQYKDYLFLPFTDETNNKETYGGGRYIDVKAGDIKNGTIEIDFNKAYNPYCAYSTGYRCPVPPQENDLPLPVTAGEKQYTGEKKHRIVH